MKLNELTSTIHKSLKASRLITEVLDSKINIEETRSQSGQNNLKLLTIDNCPDELLWIFDHESAETDLIAEGKKVEKSILHLSDEDKTLYIYAIEMKSTLKPKYILDFKEKLQGSLTHLAIYLASNQIQHSTNYKDYKIEFRMIAFCNNVQFKNKDPNFDTTEFQDFLTKYWEDRQGRQYIFDINSTTLGYHKVPTVVYMQENTEVIVMTFQDLVNMFN